jgi:hypothetical protein
MSVIDRERFDALLDTEDPGPRVSVYLPTHRAGRDIRQDPIRLKNLLRQAEDGLRAKGMPAADSAALLAPATALLDRGAFWEHQLDGLALFLDADGMREFRCPRHFDAFCYVHDHFHVKPLLPLLRWETVFHLLALSLNQVQMYEVTADALNPVDLGDMPTSLADALGHDVDEPSLQHHAGARPGAATANVSVFHGQGGGDDDRKREVVRFLQLVDEGLRQRLPDPQTPVLLVGVDELISRFHDLSRHRGLVPGGITGNVESFEPQRLHAEAWEHAREFVEADARRAAARYDEQKGTEYATARVGEVARALAAGRVESLLVAADRVLWGELDPDAGEVDLHDPRQNGDVDVIDRLAVLGLQRGADVIARRASRLPDGAAVAAVMRY